MHSRLWRQHDWHPRAGGESTSFGSRGVETVAKARFGIARNHCRQDLTLNYARDEYQIEALPSLTCGSCVGR